jgi:hypothetical protein
VESGAAYVTALVLPGSDAGLMLNAIGKQTASQWGGFTEVSRGATQFAGPTGQYVTYSGTNPTGMQAYLEMMALSHKGSTYLLMISAPANDFGRLKNAFDQMEKSFTVTAAPAAGARLRITGLLRKLAGGSRVAARWGGVVRGGDAADYEGPTGGVHWAPCRL